MVSPSSSTVSFEQHYEITCDEGFTISGSYAITCNENGRLDDHPNCIGKVFSRLGTFLQLWVYNNNDCLMSSFQFHFQTSVIMSFSYLTSNSSNFSNSNSVRSCLKPVILHETVLPDARTVNYGETYEVTCEAGRDLQGNSVMTCVSNDGQDLNFKHTHTCRGEIYLKAQFCWPCSDIYISFLKGNKTHCETHNNFLKNSYVSRKNSTLNFTHILFPGSCTGLPDDPGMRSSTTFPVPEEQAVTVSCRKDFLFTGSDVMTCLTGTEFSFTDKPTCVLKGKFILYRSFENSYVIIKETSFIKLALILYSDVCVLSYCITVTSYCRFPRTILSTSFTQIS